MKSNDSIKILLSFICVFVTHFPTANEGRPLRVLNYDLPDHHYQPLPTFTARFKNIFVFGDSLSDNGNVYNESGQVYPGSPYFGGRWSNGPTWVEYLANASGADLYNFAYGGAEACSTLTFNGTVRPNLADQIMFFQQNATEGKYTYNASSDLFIVWTGADDYFNAVQDLDQLPSGFPSHVVDCIKDGLESLLKDYQVKNLMTLNLPPLEYAFQLDVCRERAPAHSTHNSKTPYGRNFSSLVRWLANEVEVSHNDDLKDVVKDLSSDYENSRVVYMDVASLFNDVEGNPANYNVSVTDSWCFNEITGSVCNNANQYIFWDGGMSQKTMVSCKDISLVNFKMSVHPTTAAHRILAQNATHVVTEEF